MFIVKVAISDVKIVLEQKQNSTEVNMLFLWDLVRWNHGTSIMIRLAWQVAEIWSDWQKSVIALQLLFLGQVAIKNFVKKIRLVFKNYRLPPAV